MPRRGGLLKGGPPVVYAALRVRSKTRGAPPAARRGWQSDIAGPQRSGREPGRRLARCEDALKQGKCPGRGPTLSRRFYGFVSLFLFLEIGFRVKCSQPAPCPRPQLVDSSSFRASPTVAPSWRHLLISHRLLGTIADSRGREMTERFVCPVVTPRKTPCSVPARILTVGQSPTSFGCPRCVVTT